MEAAPVENEVALNPKINEIVLADNGRCDKLTPEQRGEYINWLCFKLGVDMAMRPIDLIPTQNGIKPFLNKGFAEMVRDARGISITNLSVTEQNGMYIVSCTVADKTGRTDTDIGAWPKGNEPHNALMKAVSKAKRRATLSLCKFGGLIEEAHPSEYTANEKEVIPCKTSVLLEDETISKSKFLEAYKLKTKENLSKDNILQLLRQVQKITGKMSIDECAQWVMDTELVLIITPSENPKAGQAETIAAFKEKE